MLEVAVTVGPLGPSGAHFMEAISEPCVGVAVAGGLVEGAVKVDHGRDALLGGGPGRWDCWVPREYVF